MPTLRFQPSFAAGVLGPSLHGRIDTTKYDVGLKAAFNCFVHVHGGASNRAGTQFVADLTDGDKRFRLVPFARSEKVNLVLIFGDGNMKAIEDGAILQDGGSDYQLATSIPVSLDKDGNEVVPTFDYQQSFDVLYIADRNFAPKKLSRTGNTSWTIEPLDTSPPDAAIPSLTFVSNASGSSRYKYVVTAVIDGVETLSSAPFERSNCQDLNIDGAKNTLTFTFPNEAEYAKVYRDRGGVLGYIGFSEDGSFIDDNISPDLTSTPPEDHEFFSEAADYPAIVGLHQQRLMFANTQNSPQSLFLSRIGNFEDFGKSQVLTADDGFEKFMTGSASAEIKAMLSLRELLVFTSTGEASLSGPDSTITATNPIETQFGYTGSYDIQPIVIEDTAMFVDRTGRQVRDLKYAFEQDGYSGNDLTIFANHYFSDARVSGWAYAKNPHSVVWVFLEDGRLLSFTYKREHQVWAWCDHDLSGGKVEQIAVIPEGDYDRVYMIVRRVIGGVTKRYVERMDSRSFKNIEDAWFVDCGVKHDGAPSNVVSGLGHLEGETVSVLADGNVVENLVVTGGQVTLQNAASVIIVGLPYYAEIETLPPAVELDGVGSSRGRPISITSVTVQVEKTRGLKAGASRDKLNAHIQTKGDLSLPILAQTGLYSISVFANWSREGTIILRQDFPLPMTILGAAPDLTVGRSE